MGLDKLSQCVCLRGLVVRSLRGPVWVLDLKSGGIFGKSCGGGGGAHFLKCVRCSLAKSELSWKSKLAIYQFINIPTLSYGHLWALGSDQNTKIAATSSQNGFPRWALRLCCCSFVPIGASWVGLTIWLGMPPGHFSLEVSQVMSNWEETKGA